MPPIPESYRSRQESKVGFNPSITKERLFQLGLERINDFCTVNELEPPTVTVVKRENWHFDACAYWRPDTPLQRKWGHTGIQICLDKCSGIAQPEPSRNWNWPGCTVDRTPYGVLAHEVGHLMDWTMGEKKGSYYSEQCEQFMEECKDQPLTSYCPNPAEYYAEHVRLFITNYDLLRKVRPHAYALLKKRWWPVSQDDWLKEVGQIPDRIRVAQERKIR